MRGGFTGITAGGGGKKGGGNGGPDVRARRGK